MSPDVENRVARLGRSPGAVTAVEGCEHPRRMSRRWGGYTATQRIARPLDATFLAPSHRHSRATDGAVIRTVQVRAAARAQHQSQDLQPQDETDEKLGQSGHRTVPMSICAQRGHVSQNEGSRDPICSDHGSRTLVSQDLAARSAGAGPRVRRSSRPAPDQRPQPQQPGLRQASRSWSSNTAATPR